MEINGLLDSLDIERFIGEIKKYPEIWNLTCDSYHDRIKKRSAWIKVCSAINEGFEAMNEKMQKEIIIVLSRKWKNTKDSFMKSLKKPRSGTGAKHGNKYVYYRELSFLKEACETPETESSLGVNEGEGLLHEKAEATRCIEGEPGRHEGEPARNEREPTRNDVSGSRNKRKRTNDLESSLIAFMNTPQGTVSCEPNPDRSFFESILPAVSAFTDLEKTDFRLQVLTIIQTMQRDHAIRAQVTRPPISDQNRFFPSHSQYHSPSFLTHQTSLPPPHSSLASQTMSQHFQNSDPRQNSSFFEYHSDNESNLQNPANNLETNRMQPFPTPTHSHRESQQTTQYSDVCNNSQNQLNASDLRNLSETLKYADLSISYKRNAEGERTLTETPKTSPAHAQSQSSSFPTDKRALVKEIISNSLPPISHSIGSGFWQTSSSSTQSQGKLTRADNCNNDENLFSD